MRRVPGVAGLSSTGGVVAGVVVGVVSGIGPQPASTARRTATTITSDAPRVLFMAPSTAAKRRDASTHSRPAKETALWILANRRGATRRASPAAWKGACTPRLRVRARAAGVRASVRARASTSARRRSPSNGGALAVLAAAASASADPRSPRGRGFDRREQPRRSRERIYLRQSRPPARRGGRR